MKINKLVPQGYCAGVIHSLKNLKHIITTLNGEKLYMLGMLIHNKDVCLELEKMGVIIVEDKSKTRLELLDLIPDNENVCITAHGVSDDVIHKANNKGLHIHNLTCSHVLEVKELCKKHLNIGYDILYIGKKNHPESEGIIGLSNNIYLITSLDDLIKLNIKNDKILATNQTTLSVLECKGLYHEIQKKYPKVIIQNKICAATTIRQNAVMNQQNCDLCIVVGDILSSNTQKLYEISLKSGINTILIENLLGLDIKLLKDIKTINITSGASTPKMVVDAIIGYLEQFDFNDELTHDKSLFAKQPIL